MKKGNQFITELNKMFNSDILTVELPGGIVIKSTVERFKKMKEFHKYQVISYNGYKLMLDKSKEQLKNEELYNKIMRGF